CSGVSGGATWTPPRPIWRRIGPGPVHRQVGGVARLSACAAGVPPQLSAALHRAPVHRQWPHGETQRSAGGSSAKGAGPPLESRDECCAGRIAHAAAQRRLDALLAAAAGFALARQLTRR